MRLSVSVFSFQGWASLRTLCDVARPVSYSGDFLLSDVGIQEF